MKNKLQTFLKIGIPFSIWCFLFWPIFSGKAVISSETLQIYSVVKFYIDNLKLGIFPLWDPFVMWGESTQIFLNYAGIYNPFWLLIIVFNACGLSFYYSFLFSIALYFWVGQFGFYLLAKTVLGDSRAAYFAFILFLFSSVSMSMFAQYHPQLLYIPSIWFFYFLLTFFKNPSRSSCVGLALASAVILTSYLPFYFLTVFLIVCPLMAACYFPTIKTAIPQIIRFARTRAITVILSAGVLALSFLPGYHAYLSTVNKEVVAPFRNANVEQKAGVDFTDYEKVSRNGFASRMDLEDLYANLDMIQYGDDCFFYVAFFFYIVLIMGSGLRINRVMAMTALTALPLFLLIMAVGTGFHRFIFEHVPYFKLIRNMHFFLPFFLAAMILLVAEQLRVYFENRRELAGRHRFVFFLFVMVVHAGITLFLSRKYGVVDTSFWALGFSFLFWILFILGPKRWDAVILPAVLFLSVIVQPCEVIWRHNQKALKASAYGNKALIEKCARIPSVKPVFSYMRPVSSLPFGNDDTAYSRIAMKDASRFFENGFPTFWSHDLTLKEPFGDLQQYTSYKFHVYDGEGSLGNAVDLKTTAAISGPSANFSVTHFDVNSIRIRTQYSGEKFLVYTDSYHKAWKAWINGKPVSIQRVNMAFKGLRLPPGINNIELRYSPSMAMVVSVSLSIALVLTFLFLLWFAVKERNTNEGKA